MEYLVAALALLLAVGYAVLIAVNIRKGRGWALETAQALSMLDPNQTNFELRARALEAATEVPKPEEAPAPEVIERLAA